MKYKLKHCISTKVMLYACGLLTWGCLSSSVVKAVVHHARVQFPAWVPHAQLLWHPLASSGIPWCPMASPGFPWHPLTSSDIPWHPLASPGILWHPLVSPDIPWRPLTSPGVPWHPLASSGLPWFPLSSPVVPWCGIVGSLLQACLLPQGEETGAFNHCPASFRQTAYQQFCLQCWDNAVLFYKCMHEMCRWGACVDKLHSYVTSDYINVIGRVFCGSWWSVCLDTCELHCVTLRWCDDVVDPMEIQLLPSAPSLDSLHAREEDHACVKGDSRDSFEDEFMDSSEDRGMDSFWYVQVRLKTTCLELVCSNLLQVLTWPCLTFIKICMGSPVVILFACNAESLGLIPERFPYSFPNLLSNLIPHFFPWPVPLLILSIVPSPVVWLVPLPVI